MSKNTRIIIAVHLKHHLGARVVVSALKCVSDMILYLGSKCLIKSIVKFELFVTVKYLDVDIYASRAGEVLKSY